MLNLFYIKCKYLNVTIFKYFTILSYRFINSNMPLGISHKSPLSDLLKHLFCSLLMPSI